MALRSFDIVRTWQLHSLCHDLPAPIQLRLLHQYKLVRSTGGRPILCALAFQSRPQSSLAAGVIWVRVLGPKTSSKEDESCKKDDEYDGAGHRACDPCLGAGGSQLLFTRGRFGRQEGWRCFCGDGGNCQKSRPGHSCRGRKCGFGSDGGLVDTAVEGRCFPSVCAFPLRPCRCRSFSRVPIEDQERYALAASASTVQVVSSQL